MFRRIWNLWRNRRPIEVEIAAAPQCGEVCIQELPPINIMRKLLVNDGAESYMLAWLPFSHGERLFPMLNTDDDPKPAIAFRDRVRAEVQTWMEGK